MLHFGTYSFSKSGEGLESPCLNSLKGNAEKGKYEKGREKLKRCRSLDPQLENGPALKLRKSLNENPQISVVKLWRIGNLSIFSPSLVCIQCFGLPLESCVCRGQLGGWKCTAADSVDSLSCTPATPDQALIFAASKRPGYLTYCNWWRTYSSDKLDLYRGRKHTSNRLGIFEEGESLH